MDRIREYSRLTNLASLSRRYFVIGAFDGALTVLGVVMGAYFGGSMNVKIILTSGLGGAIALGVSSFWGAWEAEKAEREKEFRELERHLLEDLSNSIYAEAKTFAIFWASFIHGIAPVVMALVPLSPFLFMDVTQAIWVSIGVTLASLFIIGVYLGNISGQNVLWAGLRMVLAGVATALICMLIGHF